MRGITSINFIITIIILPLILIIGCASTSDIDTVKNFVEPGMGISVGEAVDQICGVRGKATWRSFKPKGQPRNIVCVEVNIEKVSRLDGKRKTARLQYLLNRDNKMVELTYIEVNGMQQSLLEGLAALLLLQIE